MQRPVTAPGGAYYAHFSVYLHSVVITLGKCAEFIFTSLNQASSQFPLFLADSDQLPTATWLVESQLRQESFSSPPSPITSLPNIRPDVFSSDPT